MHRAQSAFTLIVLIGLLILAIVIGFWAWQQIGSVEIGTHGWIALGLGAVLTFMVGAGLMGAEIALVFALAGHDVLLSDRSEELLHALSVLVDHTTGRIAHAMELVEAHVDLTTRRACPFQPEVAARGMPPIGPGPIGPNPPGGGTSIESPSAARYSVRNASVTQCCQVSAHGSNPGSLSGACVVAANNAAYAA